MSDNENEKQTLVEDNTPQAEFNKSWHESTKLNKKRDSIAYQALPEHPDEDAEAARMEEERQQRELLKGDSTPVSYISKYPKWVQILITVALFMGGFNMGLNLGIMGPVMPDLMLITGTSAQMMSTIFIWRAFAFIGGSITSGLLVERYNGFLVLTIALLLQGISRMITPSMTNIWALCAVNATSIYFSTTVITCTSFLVFQTFAGKTTRVMVQLVFVTYSLGKAIVPFFVWPFLADEVGEVVNATVTVPRVDVPYQIVYARPEMALYLTKFYDKLFDDEHFALYKTEDILLQLPPVTHVQVVFYIVGVFCMLMSTIYLVVFIRTGCEVRNTLGSTADMKKAKMRMKGKATPLPEHQAKSPVLILALFFCMIMILGGVENTDSNLLMTFVVEFLGWSKDQGILLNGVFQIMKMVSCLILVPFVKRVRPSTILTYDYFCIFSSAVMMACQIGLQTGQSLFWCAVVVFALGNSNTYATQYTFLETRFQITGRVSSMFSVAMGMGMMIFPFSTTVLMASYGPIYFPVVIMCGTAIAFCIFMTLKIIMGEGICICRACQKDDTGILIEEKPLLHGSTLAANDYESMRKLYQDQNHFSPMLRRGRLSVDWLNARDKM